MLLRNLDVKRGLCKCTRIVIVELRRLNFRVKQLNATEHDDNIIIPRIPLITTEADGLPFKLRRIMFPVSLAFSVTIDKSHGQTFDCVGIYLLSLVFSYGQLYVAFSRVKLLNLLRYIYQPTPMELQRIWYSVRFFKYLFYIMFIKLIFLYVFLFCKLLVISIYML
uniref:ATP-dependent DNA helicase PIF1 n=1 Tax=Sipha flava TaxID=143950 RepID=A0A2S2QFP4_9HEMI